MTPKIRKMLEELRVRAEAKGDTQVFSTVKKIRQAMKDFDSVAARHDRAEELRQIEADILASLNRVKQILAQPGSEKLS